MAILISDKLVFSTKTVTRDKEGHYLMIKEPMQQEDIAILNVNAPNNRTAKYVKPKLTEL